MRCFKQREREREGGGGEKAETVGEPDRSERKVRRKSTK